MGLAQPRRKEKLHHDPNNKRWTENTDRVGHKILIAQGWQPGQYLGAKDAETSTYSSASASHIRVVLREDNLGLGAKKGSGVGHGECVGLDAFQSILGRLNGKEESELEKERKTREALKRTAYAENKFGAVRFVQGGYLVGDEIRKTKEVNLDNKISTTKDETLVATDLEMSEVSLTENPMKTRKEKKKDKKSKPIVEEEDDKSFMNQYEFAPKSNMVKKSKSKSREEGESNSKKQRTAEEKAIRRERKKRKAEKRNKRSNEDISDSNESSEQRKKSKKKSEKLQEKEDVDAEADDSTPQSRSPSTLAPESPPQAPRHLTGNRHAVRSRFIAQKQMAHLDKAAVDQIFMIRRP